MTRTRIKDMSKARSPRRGSRLAGAAALAAGTIVLAACSSASSSSPGSTGTHSSTPAPSTPAQASGGGTTLFPIAVGETWVYRTVGSLKGTITNKVISVVPTSVAKKVTILDHSELASLPVSNLKLTYLFYPDGSISVPYSEAGASVTIKSGGITWPSTAVIDSGQPHTSNLVIAVKEDGITTNATAKVTVRGEGTQTVTVPAGTFQATVVNQSMAEKVDGVTVTITVRTWLASGVGPVKSEAITESKTVYTEVLTSHTGG